MQQVTAPKDRLLRAEQVLDQAGIKAQSTLWYLVREGRFPPPVVQDRERGRFTRWSEIEVMQWIENMKRQHGPEKQAGRQTMQK